MILIINLNEGFFKISHYQTDFKIVLKIKNSYDYYFIGSFKNTIS